MQYNNDKKRKTMIIIFSSIIMFSVMAIGGLTYALFTSGGDDGKIGINVTSGLLQVDIVDTEQNSLVGDVLDFVTDNDNKIYFEPGATYYTQGFQVKNIGNLPLNFRMYISNDDDMDMQAFEEAFELYITTAPQSPDTAEKLTSFTGRLEEEQSSDTYYLVVKMKESAGNKFQNKTYTGIGVTVYAVQGNVEIE